MQYFSLGSFVSGLMIGVLLTGAWFINDETLAPLSSFPSFSSPLATSTDSHIPESGAISVVDQPAGGVVIVETVTVPPPGVWVAVREMNGDNLGNVLGAVRVAGPKSGLSIPLLRPTEPRRAYAIELYRDDNGGTFDPSANSVYVDFDTGARVVSYFDTID